MTTRFKFRSNQERRRYNAIAQVKRRIANPADKVTKRGNALTAAERVEIAKQELNILMERT